MRTLKDKHLDQEAKEAIRKAKEQVEKETVEPLENNEKEI